MDQIEYRNDQTGENSGSKPDSPDSVSVQAKKVGQKEKTENSTPDEGIVLTPEAVRAELDKGARGPTMALAHYLAGRHGKRLEELVRAVLNNRGLSTDRWEDYVGVVKHAVRMMEEEREAALEALKAATTMDDIDDFDDGLGVMLDGE